MAMDAQKPALFANAVPVRTGTDYPAPFDAPVKARKKRALGDAFGLDGFGVNLVTLLPGTWSSQRHWHSEEDEFIYILEGQLVLVTDAGETPMSPGRFAGFPKGDADGHHLINRSDAAAVYLEVGGRYAYDLVNYPDINLRVVIADGEQRYVRDDGTPYPVRIDS